MQTAEEQPDQPIDDIRTEAERWKAAIESAGDGVWDWNLVTNEVFLSDLWKIMLGYEPHEIKNDIGEWEKRVHPDDLRQAQIDVQNCISGKTPNYYNEHRLKCKNGSYKWILDRGRIIDWDQNGKPIRFIGTHTDINDIKDLEKKLNQSVRETRISQNLLRYIIEHSNGGIAVHDLDLNYVYVSKQYLKHYKIENLNIIGKHHYEVFPDLPQKWRDVHQRVLKGEVITADRDPYEKEDGTIEWTRWECRPWFDSLGKIGGLIVYTNVITDYIMAEKTAQDNEAKYRSLFDNMALASCLHEIVQDSNEAVNYRILDINSQYTKILHLSKEEVIGKLATEVYQTDEAPYIDIYSKVAKTGESASFEILYEPIKRYLSITASCPKPGFFSTVFSDITEVKNTQLELTRLKDQLEEEVANKTAELKDRINELERFHDATIEREFRMKELRDEIAELKNRLGE